MRKVKTSLYHTLIALISVLPLFSCGETETAAEIAVSINNGKTSVDCNSGSQFVIVEAEGSWTLSVECSDGGSWASVSPESGTGATRTVVLKYSQNEKEEARGMTLKLSSAGSSASCTLKQEGKAADNPGPSVDPQPTAVPDWMELPEMSDRDGLDFYTHSMIIGTLKTRNYSFYYSEADLISMWVAYPLNTTLKQSGSRNDAWGVVDPLVPASKQAVLNSGYKTSSGGWGFDRGHQCPSADRYEPNANRETYYPTNMTPQLGANFNQAIWAKLESHVRTWATSSDTLYVVTGCTTAGSTDYALDNVGKHVTVPTGYYKALLRYSPKSTIGFSGYLGCAVYLEHKNYSQEDIDKSMVMSIADLEKKVGVNFFPNLEAKIGKDNAAKVEAQDPKSVSWWGF